MADVITFTQEQVEKMATLRAFYSASEVRELAKSWLAQQRVIDTYLRQALEDADRLAAQRRVIDELRTRESVWADGLDPRHMTADEIAAATTTLKELEQRLHETETYLDELRHIYEDQKRELAAHQRVIDELVKERDLYKAILDKSGVMHFEAAAVAPEPYVHAECAEHPGEIEYPDSGCAKCNAESAPQEEENE